jgi:hypothetical protein
VEDFIGRSRTILSDFPKSCVTDLSNVFKVSRISGQDASALYQWENVNRCLW